MNQTNKEIEAAIDNIANIVYVRHYSGKEATSAKEILKVEIKGLLLSYANIVEKKAKMKYIKEVLLDFHKARLDGASGYDFFFKLQTDLDELQTLYKSILLTNE